MIKPIAAIGVATLVITISVTQTLHAADIAEPLIPVVSEGLKGAAFEQTVDIATPVRDGCHIGFMVNRPSADRFEHPHIG